MYSPLFADGEDGNGLQLCFQVPPMHLGKMAKNYYILFLPEEIVSYLLSGVLRAISC